MKMKNYVMTVAILSAVLTFTTVNHANANNHNGDTTPVEVKYIGQMNDQPLFQVNIKNDGKEEYLITITDKEGTRLYSDNVKGKDYNKRFLINTDEVGGNPVKLEVRAKGSDKTEVFQIKTNNRFVQETEASVTKL